LFRAGPSANDVVTSAIAVGTMRAAPKPCTARAAKNAAGAQDATASTEPAVNSAAPPRNMRRRPTRSATRPAASRKPPDGSANAVTAHCRLACPIPSPAPSRGSATFRIEKSSATMKLAAHSTSSTSLERTPPARAAAWTGNSVHSGVCVM
jgi:hypothetical protein